MFYSRHAGRVREFCKCSGGDPPVSPRSRTSGIEGLGLRVEGLGIWVAAEHKRNLMAFQFYPPRLRSV